ncbi:DHH family phosphoesterase [Pectinatus cerevisiiphilus]|uniref:Cyclic-di-AMP phosphodiesterase n=1 Tax=Pectinatus cerevisiiphilus TaxID=86956 RepID=A0A4V2URP0_9FIRM|nr:DHH family phosphoesterase [Pectinatus cerevisiiphilus]TCS78432.1 c-di-AMP phosphodiesterase-like protein [Pectinatus cerevisiiphilus]
MPRRLSSWIDICITLVIIAGLLLTLLCYNIYLAAAGLLLLICLLFFLRERNHDRQEALADYYQNVVKNINELSNLALDKLPQVILIVDHDSRLEWHNNELVRWLGKKPELGTVIHEFWPSLNLDPVWGQIGETIFSNNNKFYLLKYRPVSTNTDLNGLMALYVTDVTKSEEFKRNAASHAILFGYIQIDNYDDALQGLSEAQRTSILFETNSILDKWAHSLKAFLRRLDDDLYIIVFEQQALDLAIADKFDVLDRVRSMRGPNKFPITLSISIVKNRENIPIEDLGALVQSNLDLVLGRGGDQVAINIDGKIKFFGGKTKAVEKHTRVKSRVVAHAVSDIIEKTDMVFIMGHHNEDFDSLGASIGVAAMAKFREKEVHIILSDMNEGIDKFAELVKDSPDYAGMFITEAEALNLPAVNPVLFVVDTHIPHLVAGPKLLENVKNVVVIDHHRRSESVIQNPLLIYIEPSSSSTSELVTELLMYFSEDPLISRIDATALYAGILVDTKNFQIQTGVRTFDAVAYLRRNGADPQLVSQLFRTDYTTNLVKAKAVSNSKFFEGGLVTSVCPDDAPNIQIISAQVADFLLSIDQARMSLVFFKLAPDSIGICARSFGELNVQVLMEAFGGGGHINVAGAQVKHGNLQEIEEKAIELAKKIIKEVDNNESNPRTGSEKSREEG